LIRGAALPVDSNLNECTPTWVTANDPTWPNCLGGAGRRAAFASNMMSSNPYTIVLDGGSAFWGGLMCTESRCFTVCFEFSLCIFLLLISVQSTGNPNYMSELIALGQYHAIAITEADLYNGPGPLGQYIRQVRAASVNYIPPFLCANVDVTRESALAGLIAPSTIVTLNGTFKVGIFSMIDPLSASQTSPGPNVFFNTMYGTNNTVPSAQIVAATVTTLLNQHCDMIIMMTNVQVDRIMSLWQFPPRIDLILTTAYFNSNAPTAISSYPYVWTTLQNAKIVIAGIRDVHGSSVSVTNISLSGNRVNVSTTVSALVPLTTATQTPSEGSPVAIGKMKNLYSLLQAAAGESKAYSAVSVMGQSGTWATQGCRYTDCQMGRLITDSVLHWCQTCDVALVNAGSIRASFNAGNISFLSIAAAFPYAGAFSTFQTTGATLLAALRESRLLLAGGRYAIRLESEHVINSELGDIGGGDLGQGSGCVQEVGSDAALQGCYSVLLPHWW
jgi:2',3'-cyclic-nucleotide 2'-phosphodiesterase (5'-nucleotidase family)